MCWQGIDKSCLQRKSVNSFIQTHDTEHCFLWWGNCASFWFSAVVIVLRFKLFCVIYLTFSYQQIVCYHSPNVSVVANLVDPPGQNCFRARALCSYFLCRGDFCLNWFAIRPGGKINSTIFTLDTLWWNATQTDSNKAVIMIWRMFCENSKQLGTRKNGNLQEKLMVERKGEGNYFVGLHLVSF